MRRAPAAGVGCSEMWGGCRGGRGGADRAEESPATVVNKMGSIRNWARKREAGRIHSHIGLSEPDIPEGGPAPG